MSLWAKIRGTAETIFQLGLGGPQWNANAGAIEAKNAADNAFAIVRGATAVGASDLVPLAQLPSGAGRLLKVTLVTASSGNFTTTASTNSVQIWGCGAGGGGAGCTSNALGSACAGGGGSGAWLRKFTAVTPSTNYAFTCGAPGTTGSGAAGGNGGSSTFTIGATTYTCPGGGGAPVATSTTTVTTAFAGGAPAAVATNGDLNSGGNPGQAGFMAVIGVTTPLGFSGMGASSPFGGGGLGLTNASGTGNAANGFGAGGGGASAAEGVATRGGAPTGGCWLVEEYS